MLKYLLTTVVTISCYFNIQIIVGYCNNNKIVNSIYAVTDAQTEQKRNNTLANLQ